MSSGQEPSRQGALIRVGLTAVTLGWGAWLVAAAEPDATAPLWQESFEALPAGARLPAGWWSEGATTVMVKDGRLEQNANPERGADRPHSVVWIDREFEGDLRFEAEVEAAAAKGDVNDVVVFFQFSDPSGTPLRDTASQRASGNQNLYTDRLNGYAFFYWGKDGVTRPANIRFRDCPGGRLLLETEAYAVETGRTYHLACERRGPVLRLLADGTVLAAYDLGQGETAGQVHRKGLLGLKTWNTLLRWDNLCVRSLVAGSEADQ